MPGTPRPVPRPEVPVVVEVSYLGTRLLEEQRLDETYEPGNIIEGLV
jgi:hypothetical protein